MAANEFATMLHKNCHKIIVILIYTVLEWILILLLLLNSLFSYLIGKFAKYFRLNPSCTWCSRLDHIFDSKNIVHPRFDHVCEAHGAEISKLSYCTNHKRLSESKNLCSNCSSSAPVDYGTINETVAFFTWMREGISENSVGKRCSCCDEILSRKAYPPSLIFKPSWDVLDYYIHKKVSLSQADLMKHKIEFEGNGGGNDNDDQLHSGGRKKTDTVEEFLCDSNHGIRCEKSDSFEVQEWNSSQNDDPFWNLGCNEDDESVYLADMLLQNADYTDSDRFICIELIDNDTPSVSSQKPLTNSSDDAEEGRDNEQGLPVDKSNGVANRRFEVQGDSDIDTIGSASRLMEEHEKRDKEIENFRTPSREKYDAEAAGIQQPDINLPDSEKREGYNMTEPDDYAVGGTILLRSSDTELSVTNSTIVGLSEEQETNNQDEAEEKRHCPEATITDGLHHLHAKLTMLEKVGFELEDSSDGSITSEMEVDVESLTAEHLKTTLKAREKALQALYTELEEERKAAAEAANETMAMITKLQEEKAAMQIEALQYQRMMEEQAEYDQEALQLLNDLMMKREKEKKELEKELEIYRNKVLDYEAREKTMMVGRRKGGLSSASLGNGDNVENNSIDLNSEGEYGDDIRFGTHQEHELDDPFEDLEEMGAEFITNLTIPDVSLAEFDEERLSVLEELKILEAKLLALHDDETQQSEDAKNEEGTLNSDDHERETADFMAKKALPLFDATENQFADEEHDEAEIGNHSSGMMNQFSNRIELKNSKMLIQEELGNVYGRLQALEEDKDFLKHCIRSMMKGNKGLALLQEILQHLRDLKSVELTARNLAELPLSDASMIKEDQD